jgi:hypothetical protein
MMQMLLAFGGDWADTIATFLIFLTAGAVTGYFAFHSDLPLEEIGEAAGEFVNLSDRFRQGTVIRSAEFDEELKQLMNEKARQWRATPPLPGKYRRKYLSGYLPPRTRLSRVRRVLIWITRQIRGP